MMKMRILLGMVVVVTMAFAFSSMAVGKDLLLADYNAVEVQEFEVPSFVPAPDMSGDQLAENIVYQVKRYAQKYGLFDIIIKEGTAEVPVDKKTLLIKGEVTEYTRPTVGRRVGRSFIPSSTGDNDTVDYAMLRNAEAAAKIMYRLEK
jgi:hypothetical protein